MKILSICLLVLSCALFGCQREGGDQEEMAFRMAAKGLIDSIDEAVNIDKTSPSPERCSALAAKLRASCDVLPKAKSAEEFKATLAALHAVVSHFESRATFLELASKSADFNFQSEVTRYQTMAEEAATAICATIATLKREYGH